jgi:hypothetical protein
MYPFLYNIFIKPFVFPLAFVQIYHTFHPTASFLQKLFAGEENNPPAPFIPPLAVLTKISIQSIILFVQEAHIFTESYPFRYRVEENITGGIPHAFF